MEVPQPRQWRSGWNQAGLTERQRRKTSLTAYYIIENGSFMFISIPKCNIINLFLMNWLKSFIFDDSKHRITILLFVDMIICRHARYIKN